MYRHEKIQHHNGATAAPPLHHGAKNLLLNCAELNAGDCLLIIHEPDELDYYNNDVLTAVLDTASALGILTHCLCVDFDPNALTLTPDIINAMQRVDKTIFFARIGDQLRFADIPNGQSAIISYALTQEMLSSCFGAADYRGFMEIKQLVDSTMAKAQNISVSCPNGTAFSGRGQDITSPKHDVTIHRFPMSVFKPQLAIDFSGKIAIPGYLVGTGSRSYQPYGVKFDGVVFAHFSKGKITKFEGEKTSVNAVENHYDYVSQLFNIERNFVHSWHAGIHPGCTFDMPIAKSYERWSGAAFGNPRVLHFHTCGAYAPGEISVNIFDPTITIDDKVIWQHGVFNLERLDVGEEILQRYPCVKACFDDPKTYIGL